MDGPSGAQAPPATVHIPLRTCVGCRKREPRSELVRVVLQGDHVVVDPGGSAPGRGAWLHPGEECLAIAVKRKALPRALRSVNADVSGLVLDVK